MPDTTQATLTPASFWILDKFLNLQKQLETSLEDYELAHFVDALYAFLWDDYANSYLEYLKTDPSQSEFAKELFEQYLMILHPFDPFLTENLWQNILKKTTLLAFEKRDFMYASKKINQIDTDLFASGVQEFSKILEFVEKVRSIRGLFNLNNSQVINIYTDLDKASNYKNFLKKLIKVDLDKSPENKGYIQKNPNFSFSLDISKYVQDIDKEVSRTKKQIESLQKQILGLQNQLNNQDFLAKAQNQVIEQKQSELAERRLELETNFDKLKILGR